MAFERLELLIAADGAQAVREMQKVGQTADRELTRATGKTNELAGSQRRAAETSQWFAQRADEVRAVAAQQEARLASTSTATNRLATSALGGATALLKMNAAFLATDIAMQVIDFSKITDALDAIDDSGLNAERAMAGLARATTDAQFVHAFAVLAASTGDTTQAFAAMAKENVYLGQRLIDLARASGASKDQMDAWQAALDREIAGSKEASENQRRLKETLDGTSESVTEQARAHDQLTKSLAAQTTAALSMGNAQLGVSNAVAGAADALATYNQAAYIAANATTDHAVANHNLFEAERALQGQILGVAEAQGAAVQAQYAAAGASDAAQQGVLAQIGALQSLAQTLSPGSGLRVWLDSYIQQLLSIPSVVTTQVGIIQFRNQIDAISDGGTIEEVIARTAGQQQEILDSFLGSLPKYSYDLGQGVGKQFTSGVSKGVKDSAEDESAAIARYLEQLYQEQLRAAEKAARERADAVNAIISGIGTTIDIRGQRKKIEQLQKDLAKARRPQDIADIQAELLGANLGLLGMFQQLNDANARINLVPDLGAQTDFARLAEQAGIDPTTLQNLMRTGIGGIAPADLFPTGSTPDNHWYGRDGSIPWIDAGPVTVNILGNADKDVVMSAFAEASRAKAARISTL